MQQTLLKSCWLPKYVEVVQEIEHPNPIREIPIHAASSYAGLVLAIKMREKHWITSILSLDVSSPVRGELIYL